MIYKGIIRPHGVSILVEFVGTSYLRINTLHKFINDDYKVMLSFICIR